MSKSTGDGAEIKQEKPFLHSIRVHWGECDPAGIAYTANIPAWALKAIEAWWKHYAGFDWYELNVDHRIGTPFVHMHLDFRSAVTPRAMLDCEVRLLRLGRSSITHQVKAFQNGVLCFEGEFVAVFVDLHIEIIVDAQTKSRTPPADILAAIKSAIAKS